MFAKRAGIVALALVIGFAAAPASAASRGEQQQTVNRALRTIQNFAADPDMTWFRDNIGRARGVLIVPHSVKAGFILGGSGGGGVLLARSPRSGRWSYPAFYRMGSITFGLQIGGEVSEMVLMVMTQRGINAFLSTEFKIGGDVSVAVGPVGAGAKAQTADIIAFARTKGVYGGINIEGSAITIYRSANSAYYGRPVSAVDILIRRTVRNRGADPLRFATARIARGGRR
ncbi:MAG: lipid-binding SYLF domain-containing protein [Alphaproteobacteria bacterium]|nr:lipid-binding SYLF domain-containing protein [Alphaproteobacteria bacterium]